MFAYISRVRWCSTQRSILYSQIQSFSRPDQIFSLCRQLHEEDLDLLPIDLLCLLSALSKHTHIKRTGTDFQILVALVSKSLRQLNCTVRERHAAVNSGTGMVVGMPATPHDTPLVSRLHRGLPSSGMTAGRFFRKVLQRFADLKSVQGYYIVVPYLKENLNSLSSRDLIECLWALSILHPPNWERLEGVNRTQTQSKQSNVNDMSQVLDKADEYTRNTFWCGDVLRRLSELFVCEMSDHGGRTDSGNFGHSDPSGRHEDSGLRKLPLSGVYKMVYGLARLNIRERETQFILDLGSKNSEWKTLGSSMIIFVSVTVLILSVSNQQQRFTQ
eukprot:GHVQ01036668.1.p1 GENE.GHVQ01036668.1~~GHVQ01036668.1.p1  ORF type:complete len:330 (+),score=30.14 GHVQ01036668.1:961-1950(+)